MIPKYEDITTSISNALEEKDREEFARLKVIKRKNEEAKIAQSKKAAI